MPEASCRAWSRPLTDEQIARVQGLAMKKKALKRALKARGLPTKGGRKALARFGKRKGGAVRRLTDQITKA